MIEGFFTAHLRFVLQHLLAAQSYLRWHKMLNLSMPMYIKDIDKVASVFVYKVIAKNAELESAMRHRSHSINFPASDDQVFT